MIAPSLVIALRSRGYDVASCHEVGRGDRGIPDVEQLAYAAQHGRAIPIFNTIDHVPLDQAWKAIDRQHAGIIVAPQIGDLGSLPRRVQRHLDTDAPAAQHDLLLWLDMRAVP